LFGWLFVDAYSGKLAALGRQRDARTDDDESQRRAQASRRDAVDTGADDCRCFVHSATFLEKILPLRWSAIRRSQRTIFPAEEIDSTGAGGVDVVAENDIFGVAIGGC
jgi:hypothetical protein